MAESTVKVRESEDVLIAAGVSELEDALDEFDVAEDAGGEISELTSGNIGDSIGKNSAVELCEAQKG